MRDAQVEVLDREDVELAEALRGLGLRKAEAYLLTYLHRAGPSVSRSVEVGTSLRQPEVSMAAKRMEERGWLETGVADEEGDHRPMKLLELSRGMEGVVESLREARKGEYEAYLALAERAEDLL